MFTTVREEVKLLKAGPPGRRFETRYERHRGSGKVHRGVSLMLGLFIVFFGLLLVPLPGPGWVIVTLGFALFGGESRAISRTLDRIERALTRWKERRWDPRSTSQKRVLGTLGFLLCGALVVGLAAASYALRDNLPLI